MWNPTYAAPFSALLRRYSDTVVASFAGHTHMDDFRLIGDGSGDYAFALITPAVSPIFGQNPAFRTVAYDADGSILDQTTYELANLMEAGAIGTIPALWREEYTFTREWQLPRIDLASLEQLYAMIDRMPEKRDRWHTIFPVSSPVFWSMNSSGAAGEAQAVRAYRCATGHVSEDEFGQCYCLTRR